MIRLSVITTYRKRIHNFMRLARHIAAINNPEIEFILVSLGDDDCRVRNECERAGIKYYLENYSDIFSNGMGHNIGCGIAAGEWVMKLDVDCIPYVGFFDKLLDVMEQRLKNKTDFLNIGCYFMKPHYKINQLIRQSDFKRIKDKDIKMYCGEKIGGMLYVFNREHYLSFGGTPNSFVGFGWEDYYVIYVLKRLQDPKFKLSHYPDDGLHVVIREEIARPVSMCTNNEGLILVHLYHDKDRSNEFYRRAKFNRPILVEEVKNFESRLSENI